MPYIIYSLISIGLVLFFYQYEKKKWFMSIILAWLLGYPILANPTFLISVNFLGIDLQPDRLLLFFLTPAALLVVVKRIYLWVFTDNKRVLKFQIFEACLIAYFFSTILAYLINYGSLQPRLMVANITNVMVFFLVYFLARRNVFDQDFYILALVLFFIGMVSSIISIYQFLIDPNFFRFGISRIAFSVFIRANGLFAQEFEQGMFLIMAFVICWEALPKPVIRVIMTIVFSLGVFTTMHRLSWLIFIFSFATLWFISIRKHNYFLELIGLFTVAVIGISLWTTAMQLGSSNRFVSDLINERIGVDNLSIRFDLNDFAIRLISKYPMGVGEYETNTYQQEAYVNGIDFVDQDIALVIHNGFLAAGVRYGFIGLTAFLLFFISSILFFVSNLSYFGKQWFMPILIILIFFLFNTTQDFSFIGQELPIFFGLLLGCFAAHIDNRKKSVNIDGSSQIRLAPLGIK